MRLATMRTAEPSPTAARTTGIISGLSFRLMTPASYQACGPSPVNSWTRPHATSVRGLIGLPREKVLATVVSLLEKTLIRVGNAEYASSNKSYGLTTMRRRHVSVKGSTLRFSFTGKSGKQWNLAVENKRIALIVRRCADISGHELFKYLDEAGEPRAIDSGDVNAYIKEITQQDFSAKDFRTWAGTVLAALVLAEYKKYNAQAEAKRIVVAAIEKVARQLGNTPAICRKCYVHPEILEAYMSGDLAKMIEGKIADQFRKQHAKLSADEVMVLAFLNKRLKRARKSP